LLLKIAVKLIQVFRVAHMSIVVKASNSTCSDSSAAA
jgi:hypothetical protein